MGLPATYAYFDVRILHPLGHITTRIWGEVTTPPTATEDWQAVADGFGALLAPKVKALLSVESAYKGVAARFHSPAVDFDCFSGSGAGVGSAGNPVSPPGDALIIQKRTGTAGRDKRGRYFIGGFASGDSDDGILVDGSDTKVALAALATFLGANVAIGANTWHQRHLDRKTSTLLTVTQARPLSVIGSRRDRRQFEGLSNSFY